MFVQRTVRHRASAIIGCALVTVAVISATSPASASSPTMPLPSPNDGFVLSAGTNGREVIVGPSDPRTGTPVVGGQRIDHLTGVSTALPDLVAVSADSSAIVTTDFQWMDLDSSRYVPLPKSVPHDFSSIVLSADGATIAARQPLGQRTWVIDVNRAAGTATASLLPVTGVVESISSGGRWVLLDTNCSVRTLQSDPPFIDCPGRVRWDRLHGVATTLSGAGRRVGMGIGIGGEVIVFDVPTLSTTINRPGRAPITLTDAPSGFPFISPDAQTVIFVIASSGFTEWDIYDVATATSAFGLAFRDPTPTPGEHTDTSAQLSTDGSTLVATNTIYQPGQPRAETLEWRPFTARPSTARVRPGEVMAVHVAGPSTVGTSGIGADASSVMLSVTITDPVADGFATVWPCGELQPLASNLNFIAGQTRANAVLTKVGANGDICIASNVAVNMIVDTQGSFGPTSTYHALTPARLVDTRFGRGATTGAVNSGSGLRIPVIGSNGAGVGAAAVMLNVTATNATADGFVTVWPCDTPRPTASNLNVSPGATVANAVLTAIGGGGDVCVSSNVATDIVIDVQGWFESSADYHAVLPVRLADTRLGEVDTVGNLNSLGTLIVPISSISNTGVPAGATGAMVNVTITNPDQSGFAIVWPCDEARPLASNISFRRGETVAVAALARISAGGAICIGASTQFDVIVDLDGWTSSAISYRALVPSRATDTRI